MFKISNLHYITQGDISGFSHAQLAEQACSGGIDWVQVRVKDTYYSEWKSVAEDTLKVCRQFNAKCIINDNVELAKEINADGVHIGKEDMSPAEARKFLGGNFIIGATANTFEDIQKHSAAQVDYIGLGPFRFTSTKKNLSPVLGIEGYIEIIKQCKKENITTPIIAIGGIKPEDLNALFEAGLHGVAIASIINNATDKKEAAFSFVKNITEASKKHFKSHHTIK